MENWTIEAADGSPEWYKMMLGRKATPTGELIPIQVTADFKSTPQQDRLFDSMFQLLMGTRGDDELFARRVEEITTAFKITQKEYTPMVYPKTGNGFIAVWSAGSGAQGDDGLPVYWGYEKGETLNAAIERMAADGRIDLQYLSRNPETDEYSFWCCKFYDNEEDAKNFK